MSWPIVLYRLLLPVYVLVAFPAWLWKMARRGGFGSGLLERIGWYRDELEFEPLGVIHVHAVSVGESLLALKLIRAWRDREPHACFVLGVATATGHQVAMEAAMENVRVVYQPLDFRVCVARYLNRFEPHQLVLVEGEMWPNLLAACERRGIPVSLVNARMSPRSRRRYLKFASMIRPVFSKLSKVALQEPSHAGLWQTLGVPADRVKATGSLKFDAANSSETQRRPEFEEMIEQCAEGRPVVLAASTHPGEEVLIAEACRRAGVFPLCVPRHAERRAEVKQALEAVGFEVVLRSDFKPPQRASECILVVDSTGEMRDWTAHAACVVIGKSFLGTGGQNPAEAIQAGVPVVFGPHMENFEPLASQLVSSGGVLQVKDGEDLSAGIASALRLGTAPDVALRCLEGHLGATERILDWVRSGPESGSRE